MNWEVNKHEIISLTDFKGVYCCYGYKIHVHVGGDTQDGINYNIKESLVRLNLQSIKNNIPVQSSWSI